MDARNAGGAEAVYASAPPGFGLLKLYLFELPLDPLEPIPPEPLEPLESLLR
jgi:hypothetical protein